MASVNFEQLKQLKEFVQLCEANPKILHMPELSFFRTYLERLGAKVPVATEEEDEVKPEESRPAEASPTKEEASPTKEAASPTKEEPSPVNEESKVEEEEELIESDVELEDLETIPPDNDEEQEMGDENKEVSEEDSDLANSKRSEGQNCFSEGQFDKAVECFTEAIRLNPSSAAFFAKRANCYLKLKKPNAAIRDCDRAVALNPDNALAYKYRGRANRLLGNWEKAAGDLATACKIDYDDEANEWLKEVQPNARKIAEHNRKYERQRFERDLKERQERIKKAREAATAAAAAQAEEEEKMGGGRFGEMPGLSSLLLDPEISAALQDPEVAAAFQDISQNPANMLNYQSNPKVSNLITKMIQKMGSGGVPGGFEG